jgi:hypothetical protein
MAPVRGHDERGIQSAQRVAAQPRAAFRSCRITAKCRRHSSAAAAVERPVSQYSLPHPTREPSFRACAMVTGLERNEAKRRSIPSSHLSTTSATTRPPTAPSPAPIEPNTIAPRGRPPPQSALQYSAPDTMPIPPPIAAPITTALTLLDLFRGWGVATGWRWGCRIAASRKAAAAT